VVSRDLGTVGPKDGEPIIVDWWSGRGLLAAVAWLLLVPLFLHRSNRDRRALWVLAPLLAVQVAATCVGLVLPAQVSSAFSPFLAVGSSLGLGLAGVWLLGDVLAPMPRVAAFFAALATMCVIGGARAMAVATGGQAIWYGVAQAVLSLILLLALVAAARGCRQHYSPPRFSGLVGLACLLLSALTAACIMFIGALTVMGRSFDIAMIATMLMGCMMSAAVLGVALAAIVLLFMVPVYRCDFYRQRFTSVFGFSQETPQTTGPEEPERIGKPEEPEREGEI